VHETPIKVGPQFAMEGPEPRFERMRDNTASIPVLHV
jgi:hypothetical protein